MRLFENESVAFIMRARHALSRHRPRKRATQYSEAFVIEPKSRGVLDTPLSRSMTVFVRRKRAFAHPAAFESR
jgi:hypothetical protein